MPVGQGTYTPVPKGTHSRNQPQALYPNVSLALRTLFRFVYIYVCVYDTRSRSLIGELPWVEKGFSYLWI